jgi:hypothetical protein
MQPIEIQVQSRLDALTARFESVWKCAVLEDWMWRHSGTLVTHHPVIEPVSEIRGTEFFDAETEGPDPPFCLAETDAETRTNSKKPAVPGQIHGSPAEFDT